MPYACMSEESVHQIDKLLPGEGELKGIRDVWIKFHAPIHWLHITWVR